MKNVDEKWQLFKSGKVQDTGTMDEGKLEKRCFDALSVECRNTRPFLLSGILNELVVNGKIRIWDFKWRKIKKLLSRTY